MKLLWLSLVWLAPFAFGQTEKDEFQKNFDELMKSRYPPMVLAGVSEDGD